MLKALKKIITWILSFNLVGVKIITPRTLDPLNPWLLNKCKAKARKKRMFSFYESGFTLLEILIAIVIFGMVITTIFLSYNALEGSNRAIARDLSDYEMARICFDRITADLNNLHVALPPSYRPPENDKKQDPFRISGEREDCNGISFSKIAFASYSHLPISGKKSAGIARISYYPQEGEDGVCLLKRSDRLYLADDNEKSTNDPILAEGIKRFEITYLDTEGEAHEMWDSDSDDFEYLTPRAILINMVMGDKVGSRQFSTMISLPVLRSNIEKDS